MIYYYNKVKFYRETIGVSQKVLADLCDCSRQTISSIENGVFFPSCRLALSIVYYLNVAKDIFETDIFYIDFSSVFFCCSTLLDNNDCVLYKGGAGSDS